MKIRIATLALLAAAIPCVSGAATAYRITLRGNSTVISRDQPIVRGTVVTFHRSTDGRITGLPQEEIATIEPVNGKVIATRTTRNTRTVRTVAATGTALPAAMGAGNAVPSPGVRALKPGEAVAIGPTGAGSGTATTAATATNGAQGSAATGTPASPNSNADIHAKAAMEAQVFPGDLPTPGGTAGSGTTAINPILNTTAAGTTTTTGATAAGQPGAVQPVGANGFPTTTGTTPQPGDVQPIGANGFPTTASSPQPGAVPPVGANGFPTTGTAATSSPNGTTTNPNGTVNNGTTNNGTATSGSTTSAPPAAKGGKGGKS